MPSQAIIYKCMLMSPGDVTLERDALTALTNRWNAQIGSGLQARVDLVRRESHSVPDMAMPAQEAINSQLVRGCDFGIAVFWSRLGSATEKHPSGSAEEIYELRQKGARVMVYFCKRSIPQEALRDDQFPKLMELKKDFSKQGLYAEYSDTSDLEQQVLLHITSVVTGLLSNDRNIPVTTPLTAPTPDVRIHVNPAFLASTHPLITDVKTYLSITVENHSPVPVFLKNVSFQMKDGQMLLPPRDETTGELPGQRELQSGNDYTAYIDPERLRQHMDKIVCAQVVDAVGRTYRSDATIFHNILAATLKSIDEG